MHGEDIPRVVSLIQQFDASEPCFSDDATVFSIDAAGINTESDLRDKHLQSDDFFNAEKYPKIQFTSVSWKKIEGRNYRLVDDMTIRDTTKRISFDVVYGGTTKDGYGKTSAGFNATTVIDRFDYNLKWNALTEAGAVVGKGVAITLNLEFVKQLYVRSRLAAQK